MNVTTLIPYIYERLGTFVLDFTRISAFFSTFVFFQTEIVNKRIILAISLILAFYSMFLYQIHSLPYDFFSIKMLVQIAYQFFVGMIGGLILNVTFEIFTALGQIISMQTGLSLAAVLDPRLGSITSLTAFYMYTLSIIFFSINGHLFVMKLLSDSFMALPIDKILVPQALLLDIMRYSTVMFSGAVGLAMSIIVTIMITNFALAMMSRFAPQFNLFSIGINMALILGLICVYITYNLTVVKGMAFLQEAMAFIHSILTRLK